MEDEKKKKQLQIYAGLSFTSFEEVENFINQYRVQERNNFFVGKKSKTLTSYYQGSDKIPSTINKELKYYKLDYVCQFGKGRSTESKGLRQTM